MARVQNLDSIRDNDVLDTANMSKFERLELLSMNFYETLARKLADATNYVSEFEHASNQPQSSNQDDDDIDDVPQETPQKKVKKPEDVKHDAIGLTVPKSDEKETGASLTQRHPPQYQNDNKKHSARRSLTTKINIFIRYM